MISNKIHIDKVIKPFNKVIEIEGDKSLSIRWALLASQANGRSMAKNLLKSEDVINTLECLKRLGVNIKLSKDKCEIYGLGLNGFKYNTKVNLYAGNSGTLARLILGLLVHSKSEIKITGDKSLSKRDFSRVTVPLKKFGANIKTKNGKLPITIFGTDKPKPINYVENRGSAQCKSAVMLAALNTNGQTIIKAKKSRNHSEIIFKYLKIPIKIRKLKNYDIIKVDKPKKIKPFNYKIPADISSTSFFIILATLSKNSKLKIKNVNINPSRAGIIKILSKMGVNISTQNIKYYKGEKIADLSVGSTEIIRPINCPKKFNTSAIDEFLLIFLVAAKAKGISYFKDLAELNQKESPRLKWGSKILTLIGVKNIVTKNSIKIFGNPNLVLDKKIVIKNFQKDHRVFMTSVIAALTLGGKWTIHDKDSIKTSFPSFLNIINYIKNNT